MADGSLRRRKAPPVDDVAAIERRSVSYFINANRGGPSPDTAIHSVGQSLEAACDLLSQPEGERDVDRAVGILFTARMLMENLSERLTSGPRHVVRKGAKGRLVAPRTLVVGLESSTQGGYTRPVRRTDCSAGGLGRTQDGRRWEKIWINMHDAEAMPAFDDRN